MRPSGFRPREDYEHGTRSRYTSGCRCAGCRAANAKAYHDRRARDLEALAELAPVPPAAPAAQSWHPRGGAVATRTYRRVCPGVNGTPCDRVTCLRSDSLGGICARCRRRLSFNGLVDAGAVRAHLLRLSRKGIGWKSVADAADVSKTVLWEVRCGRKKWIRAKSAARVLAVDEGARAGGALVPAARTWQRIERLLTEGFTKKEIARRLGRKSSLQLRPKRITARSELAIARLYRLVMT